MDRGGALWARQPCGDSSAPEQFPSDGTILSRHAAATAGHPSVAAARRGGRNVPGTPGGVAWEGAKSSPVPQVGGWSEYSVEKNHQVQEWIVETSADGSSNGLTHKGAPNSGYGVHDTRSGSGRSSQRSGMRVAHNTPVISLHSVLNDMENDILDLRAVAPLSSIDFAVRERGRGTPSPNDPVTMQLGCARCHRSGGHCASHRAHPPHPASALPTDFSSTGSGVVTTQPPAPSVASQPATPRGTPKAHPAPAPPQAANTAPPTAPASGTAAFGHRQQFPSSGSLPAVGGPPLSAVYDFQAGGAVSAPALLGGGGGGGGGGGHAVGKADQWDHHQWDAALRERDGLIRGLEEDVEELRRQLMREADRKRDEMDEMLEKMQKQHDVTQEYKQALVSENERKTEEIRLQIEKEYEERYRSELALLLRLQSEKEAESILHQEEFRREARDSVALLIKKQQDTLLAQLEEDRRVLQAEQKMHKTAEQNLQLRVAASEEAERAFLERRGEVEADLASREEALKVYSEKLDCDNDEVRRKQREFAAQQRDYEESLTILKEKTAQLSGVSQRVSEREAEVRAAEEKAVAKRGAIEEAAKRIEERDAALDLLAAQLVEKEESVVQASRELTALQQQLEERRTDAHEGGLRNAQREEQLAAERARHEEAMRAGLQRLTDQHLEDEKHIETAKAAVQSLREGAQKEADAVRAALAKQHSLNEEEGTRLMALLQQVEAARRDIGERIEKREFALFEEVRVHEAALVGREEKLAEREAALQRDAAAQEARLHEVDAIISAKEESALSEVRAQAGSLSQREEALSQHLQSHEHSLRALHERSERVTRKELEIASAAQKLEQARSETDRISEKVLQVERDVAGREKTIGDKARYLAEQEESLKERSDALTGAQHQQASLSAESESLRERTASAEQALLQREMDLKERDATLADTLQACSEQSAALDTRASELATLEQDATTRLQKAEELYSEVLRKEESLAQQEAELKRLAGSSPAGAPPADPPSFGSQSMPSTAAHDTAGQHGYSSSSSATLICLHCKEKLAGGALRVARCGNKVCLNVVTSPRHGSLCHACESEGVVIRGEGSAADSVEMDDAAEQGITALKVPLLYRSGFSDNTDDQDDAMDFHAQHSGLTSRRATVPVAPALHTSWNSAMISNNSLADTSGKLTSLSPSPPLSDPTYGATFASQANRTFEDLLKWLASTEERSRHHLAQVMEENWILMMSDVQHSIMVENDVATKLANTVASQAPGRTLLQPHASFSLSSSPVGAFSLPPRSVSPLAVDGLPLMPQPSEGPRSVLSGDATRQPGSTPGAGPPLGRQMSYSQRSAASSPSPVDLSLLPGQMSVLSSSINSPLTNPQTPMYTHEFPSLMDALWSARDDMSAFEDAWGKLKNSVQRDTTYAARLGFKLNTELKDVRLQLEDHRDLLGRMEEEHGSLQHKISELSSEKRHIELQYDYAAEQIRQDAEDVKECKTQLDEMKTNSHWRERELLTVMRDNRRLEEEIKSTQRGHVVSRSALLAFAGIWHGTCIMRVAMSRLRCHAESRLHKRCRRQMEICRKAALGRLGNAQLLIIAKYYQLLLRRPQRNRRVTLLVWQSARQHLSQRFRVWSHFIERRFLQERHNQQTRLVEQLRSMRRLRRANMFADRFDDSGKDFLIGGSQTPDMSPRTGGLS